MHHSLFNQQMQVVGIHAAIDTELAQVARMTLVKLSKEYTPNNYRLLQLQCHILHKEHTHTHTLKRIFARMATKYT